MKLSIKERLIFIALYPEKSDFLTQNILRDVSDKIKFSEEEIKEINLKFADNRWTWDEDKNIEKDVEFTSVESDILKAQVERLDKEKAITQTMLDICKKIKDA